MDGMDRGMETDVGGSYHGWMERRAALSLIYCSRRL